MAAGARGQGARCHPNSSVLETSAPGTAPASPVGRTSVSCPVTPDHCYHPPVISDDWPFSLHFSQLVLLGWEVLLRARSSFRLFFHSQVPHGKRLLDLPHPLGHICHSRAGSRLQNLLKRNPGLQNANAVVVTVSKEKRRVTANNILSEPSPAPHNGSLIPPEPEPGLEWTLCLRDSPRCCYMKIFTVIVIVLILITDHHPLFRLSLITLH